MKNDNKIQIDSINENLLVNIKLPTIYLLIRRLLEIILILLMSPIIILICLITGAAIKLTSPGPLFFVQKRPGINDSVFDVYKFRTMKYIRKSPCDIIKHIESDVTFLGKFLRKHRIDELPQFWNILKGDMSLIGPRPEPLHYYRKCLETIPLYRYRFRLRPGITGWAQVWYRHTDDVESVVTKLEYDIYYMMNISWKTDIIIFLKTFKVILFGTGAK